MDPRDRERYGRQVQFPGIGAAGQERLLAAHAAIVGCGALGAFHAAALARAGVGRLTLIDRDYVELANLHRQWLYDESDAEQGLPKAIAAAQALARINSSLDLRPVVADLSAANAGEILDGAAVILDGTDNFETRYLVNDFAVQQGIPWIYGAAVGGYGLVMPVIPGRTACLRCVYPDPPGGVQPTCETAGILNAVTSAVASLQVMDALKILAGRCDAVQPRITTLDLWDGPIRQVAMPSPGPDCPACARREFVWLEEKTRPPVRLCGRNAVQLHERPRPLDLAALARVLGPLGEVRANLHVLRFTAPPYELTVFPDGRAIVKGTADVGVARSLYARYIGA
jgi:molybdopterin/thiamine biosynthesis adenylyltransferase